jgi:type IV pilus assembly protein PilN
MIRINLFPFRAARIKENIRRQITYYFGSVIIILLAITYFYIDFSREIGSLKHKLDEQRKELATYKDTNVKIANLKKTIADIEIKLKTITELEKVKTGPVKLLDDIAMSVPKDKLWLASLRENKGTLMLEGTAMDNETVADFMDRLQDKGTIKSVELVRTRQRKISGSDLSLKDFALKCTTYAFKEPEAPKPKKKKRK